MNNSHLIRVKYLGPTNFKGSRVSLSTYDLSHSRQVLKAKRIVLHYDHVYNSSDDQAVDLLKKAGLVILGKNERGPDTYIMCEWDYDKLAKLFNLDAV